MFVNTNNLILSLLELPTLYAPDDGMAAGLITASSQVRILLRSLNGRFCWDASVLFCTPEQLEAGELGGDEGGNYDSGCFLICERFIIFAAEKNEERLFLLNSQEDVEDTPFISYVTNSPNTIRHRQPHVLPTVENSAPDLDNLDDVSTGKNADVFN